MADASFPLPEQGGTFANENSIDKHGQACAGSYRGTITLCAVPVISMQRQVEGRCGTESGPLKVS